MPQSVRPAVAADAAALAAVQRAAYLALLGADVPALAAALDPAVLAATWRNAIELATPGSPYAVFAALDRTDHVVGFAAIGPLTDPDARPGATELVALWVHPDHQRDGHGSRLLAAVADAVRSRPAPSPAAVRSLGLPLTPSSPPAAWAGAARHPNQPPAPTSP
ncbi:MAG: GNAT family N-acetyltransferase, partial [Bifidobacteriaceae bacterium]|nr:GNAT family N-acetyltransferase [Bifidobacteriaceae bacterium]